MATRFLGQHRTCVHSRVYASVRCCPANIDNVAHMNVSYTRIQCHFNHAVSLCRRKMRYRAYLRVSQRYHHIRVSAPARNPSFHAGVVVELQEKESSDALPNLIYAYIWNTSVSILLRLYLHISPCCNFSTIITLWICFVQSFETHALGSLCVTTAIYELNFIFQHTIHWFSLRSVRVFKTHALAFSYVLQWFYDMMCIIFKRSVCVLLLASFWNTREISFCY